MDQSSSGTSETHEDGASKHQNSHEIGEGVLGIVPVLVIFKGRCASEKGACLSVRHKYSQTHSLAESPITLGRDRGHLPPEQSSPTRPPLRLTSLAFGAESSQNGLKETASPSLPPANGLGSGTTGAPYHHGAGAVLAVGEQLVQGDTEGPDVRCAVELAVDQTFRGVPGESGKSKGEAQNVMQLPPP